jgi:hypothetical protein
MWENPHDLTTEDSYKSTNITKDKEKWLINCLCQNLKLKGKTETGRKYLQHTYAIKLKESYINKFKSLKNHQKWNRQTKMRLGEGHE